MKMYGMPTLLIPLQDRVKGEMVYYLKEHSETLTPGQAAMLNRYIENDDIHHVMVNSFYNEWESNDRRGSLESFMKKCIQQLLEVYE